MWYYFEILHLSYTFFTVKVSKKCNTNLIGQCESPRTWLPNERCRDTAVHFSNLGGAEGGALFFGLRYEKLRTVTALYSRIVERRCFRRVPASLVPRPSAPRPFGKLEREKFSEGAWCGGSGDETRFRLGAG